LRAAASSRFVGPAVVVRRDEHVVSRLPDRELTREGPRRPMGPSYATDPELPTVLRDDFGLQLTSHEISALAVALPASQERR
jgi:hypothetical protein